MIAQGIFRLILGPTASSPTGCTPRETYEQNKAAARSVLGQAGYPSLMNNSLEFLNP
jgi:hypothetical protein